MRVIFPKVTCFKHLYPYVYREFVAYIKRVPFEHNEWVVVMPFHFLNCILELAYIMVAYGFFVVMESLRNRAILVPSLNGSHFLTDALSNLLVAYF